MGGGRQHRTESIEIDIVKELILAEEHVIRARENYKFLGTE
jgi:hypothetical protein